MSLCKCGKTARSGQRTCAECHAAYMRLFRERSVAGLRTLLCDVVRVLDWHKDGTPYTDFEEEVRKRVSELQEKLE